MVNLKYYYIIGEGVQPPEGVNLSIANADILLDLTKLAKTLDLAQIQKMSPSQIQEGSSNLPPKEKPETC